MSFHIYEHAGTPEEHMTNAVERIADAVDDYVDAFLESQRMANAIQRMPTNDVGGLSPFIEALSVYGGRIEEIIARRKNR